MGSILRLVRMCLVVLSSCNVAGGAFSPQRAGFPGLKRFRSTPLLMRTGTAQRLCSLRRSSSSLYINLNWFSGKSNEDRDGTKDEKAGDSSSEQSRAVAGGVADTMDSMENFKRSQRVGKLTRKLVQDLASTTIEGVAADGKVKVILDGQQRPLNVDIDESYVNDADVSDLCSAITAAMSDAHAKSIERMDEKMKSLYSELGLPSSG